MAPRRRCWRVVLLPEARTKLGVAWEQERELEGLWADVGKALGAGVLDGEPWPPLPERQGSRAVCLRSGYRAGSTNSRLPAMR